jgi:hypothetical protein
MLDQGHAGDPQKRLVNAHTPIFSARKHDTSHV